MRCYPGYRAFGSGWSETCGDAALSKAARYRNGKDRAVQKLRRYKQRIVPSSGLFKLAIQFLVRQLPTLRALQQLLRFCYGGIPFVYADFSSLPSDLQTVAGPVILFLGWSVVRLPLGLLSMSANLSTGALQLTGSDVVAVTRVVPGGQQENKGEKDLRP